MPLLGAGVLARKIEDLAAGGRRLARGRAIARRRATARSSTDAGFASVDAVVALTILAATIALVLENAGTAKRLADAALETRQAEALGQFLLETGGRRPGAEAGQANGFRWSLDVVATTAANTPKALICKRNVELTALRSGRRYGLATAEPCPPLTTS